MKGFLFWATIPICSFLPAVSVYGEPKISVETVYYDVQGKNLEEVRKELDAKSPVRHGEDRYHANTAWSVTWKMRWNVKSFSCDVVDVTSQVNIKVTLPRWVGLEDLDPEVREEWERYDKALAEHENGHRDLAVEAGKKIEEEIRKMGSRENCSVLKRDANRIGRRIVSAYERLSESYDRETDHGRKLKNPEP